MNWKQAFSLGLIAPGMWDGDSGQWETLFEGTAETTAYRDLYRASLLTSGADYPCFFAIGDSVRITVNVTQHTYTAVEINPGIWFNGIGAGNPYLYNDYNGVDDGGNYAVVSAKALVGDAELMFFSRNPGTYTVKVERKL